MADIPLLRDLVMLMGMSVVISIILSRTGIATIVGFFLTGAIIGPYGSGLVTEISTVETLAEIGIVLLLFTIGLEFSVKRMLNIKKEAMLGGGLQLGLTVSIVLVLSVLSGYTFEKALLLGFIIAMSSSAIVLKLLMDRAEVDSPQGSLSVGILLFQDISVVLMVMLIQGNAAENASFFLVLKGLVIAAATMALIVVTSAYIVPLLFHEVVKLRNREVFILTIVLVCLGTAWAASLAGLSLAIGAFIAGLVVSESEYSSQILAEAIPFRDIFASLFFISMGMLLDIRYFAGHAWWIIIFSALVIGLKALIIFGVGQLLKYPLRLSVIVGLNLAQIGEFSFILIKMGKDHGLLAEGLYQSILAVSVMTLVVTPFIFQRSEKAAARLGRIFGLRLEHAFGIAKTHLLNHVIIIGYGLNGQNLARVLKETAIERIILDMNSQRVKQARRDGHRAWFGDASHPELLRKMGVERAKMLVVGITDTIGTRRIVACARQLNPTLTILVRTRHINETEELQRLGANEVITEEFETSVEIFARVLKEYKIPGNIIQNQIDIVRHEGYAMLRGQSLSQERLAKLASILDTSVTETFLVETGSPIEGKTLMELDIRKKTGGATVMAAIRKGRAHTNPRGEFAVEAGDCLVILGSHAELNKAMEILRGKQD